MSWTREEGPTGCLGATEGPWTPRVRIHRVPRWSLGPQVPFSKGAGAHPGPYNLGPLGPCLLGDSTLKKSSFERENFGQPVKLGIFLYR